MKHCTIQSPRRRLTQTEINLSHEEADAIRDEASNDGLSTDEFIRATTAEFVDKYRKQNPSESGFPFYMNLRKYGIK